MKPCEGLADLFEEAKSKNDSLVSDLRRRRSRGIQGATDFQIPARHVEAVQFVREAKNTYPYQRTIVHAARWVLQIAVQPLEAIHPRTEEVGSISGLLAGPGSLSFATTMAVEHLVAR